MGVYPRSNLVRAGLLLVLGLTVPSFVGAVEAASEEAGSHFLVGVEDLDGRRGDEALTLELSANGRSVTLRALRLGDGRARWERRFDTAIRRSAWYGGQLRGRVVEVADLTRDGRSEVILIHHRHARQLSTPNSGVAAALVVTVMDGRSGATLWTHEEGSPVLGLTDERLPLWLAVGGLRTGVHPMRDVDGDGRRDLLVSYDEGYGAFAGAWPFGIESRVVAGGWWVLSGATGAVIGAKTPEGRSDWREVVPTRDLSGDRAPDVVEAGSGLCADQWELTVAAYSIDGELHWKTPCRFVGWRPVDLLEVELDGDRGPEFLVAGGSDAPESESWVGNAIALDGADGAVLWRIKGDGARLAGDLNGDAIDDFITSGCSRDCTRSTVDARSGRDLSRLWRRAFNPPSFSADAALCCEDLTGDGTPDVVVATSAYVGDTDRRISSKLALDGSDGSVVWKATRSKGWPARPIYAAGGDVNANGTADILSVGTRDGGRSVRLVYRDGATARRIWTGLIPAPSTEAWAGDAVLASRGRRGVPLVLVGINPVGGASPIAACRIHALMAAGRQWSFPDC